jgi:hypothetical protein
MSRYTDTDMLDEEHNEIMRDVRARQAEVREMYKRFEGDPEGLKRERESNLARLGFRYEPTGHGTTRLVKIEQPQEEA